MRIPMKFIRYYIIMIFLLIPESDPLSAQPVDLTKSDLFVARGFSKKWITSIPEDSSWIRVPGVTTGRRSIRINELVQTKPARSFLSFTRYPSETFTYVTDFSLSEQQLSSGKILGLYLSQIGMNWEIYLNGRLIKSEMHIRQNGEIFPSKNMRDVLALLHPDLLKDGQNILAFRIVGDPTYQETGFYWNGAFYIDEYETLLDKNSETIPLILISIYLFIGIYHLFLFFKRTSEQYNLYFGSYCVLLFVYILTRTHTVYSLVSDTTLITRIELISLYFLLPISGAFLDLILNSKISLITIRYGIFCIILEVFNLFAPLQAMIDILFIWQITALIFLLYMLIYLMGRSFIREIGMAKRSGKPGALKTLNAVATALLNTVSGKLVIGTFIAICCGIFDILDAIYFYTGIALLKYGFVVYVVGTTLILATRFQNLFTRVEELNISLQRNIDDLNVANATIALSEEKYRLLVDGSQDVIFSLDEDFKFLSANKAMKSVFALDPDKIKGISFFDILYEGYEKPIARHLVREQVDKFIKEKKPVQFKIDFKIPYISEPHEMMLKLEYVNIVGKNEILGKISGIIEDALLKYFVMERQNFKIGNYLFTAEEISHRLTRNLAKHIDQKEINMIRIALREIIVNAIEHGNLGISFEEKSNAVMMNKYFEIISQRQNDPLYRHKTVDIKYQMNEDQVAYQIVDEGSGFDYTKILNHQTVDHSNAEMLGHGRGIAIAKNIFDRIIFSSKGNKVTLVKSFTKKPD